MIHKDYILQMIEQLGQALVRVLLKRKSGNSAEALEEIEESFSDILGFNSLLLHSLSAKDLAELFGLSKDKLRGSMKCLAAARLLKEKLEIEESSGARLPEAEFEKTLYLFLEGLLNLEYKELKITDFFPDVKALTDRLGNRIPTDILQKLFLYYRSIKNYNQAGNVLFWLKEKESTEIRETAESYFTELEALDEAGLKAADMTREEIAEDRADFFS